jgi:hypothetical protein
VNDTRSPLWFCFHCEIAQEQHFCAKCGRLGIPMSAAEIEKMFPRGVVWAGKDEGVAE